MHHPSHFIVLFLDGVGLGCPGRHNPLSETTSMPFLSAQFNQCLLTGLYHQTESCLAKPIDATLQIEGLPQSATGQTTIYTGRNAPKFLGRHQTGFANGSLRILIDESGLFKQIMALGGTATLANLYSPAYFEAIAHRKLRYSVCTLLNLSVGLPFRMQYEYERGQAIYWDITGELAHDRGLCQRIISPEEAGTRLSELGQHHTVTVFECYLPDFTGHAQDFEKSLSCLQRIDRFIQSTINSLPSQVTLIITSDHGNVEDLSTKRHTFNPVPLLVFGPHALAFTTITDLTGITPKIVDLVRQEKVDGKGKSHVAS